MAHDDGGPAFAHSGCPHSPEENDADGTPEQQGMSLRDWFAGQALVGICAQCANGEAMEQVVLGAEERGINPYQQLARAAYIQADALIAARTGGAK